MKNFLYNVAAGEAKGPLAIVVKCLLWLLSWMYWVAISLRNIFYHLRLLKVTQVAAPVISIGNLTVGGTGKTPFVHYLVNHLQSMDRQPAILTRGYMAEEGQASDEALMLKHSLSGTAVLVGRNRIKNAQDYLKINSTDVFIMDDGFQHRKLHRDLDIVLIDCTQAWSNAYLLPCGLLREPKRALKRADIIVLNKSNINPEAAEQIKNELCKGISSSQLIVTAEQAPIDVLDLKNDKELLLSTLDGVQVVAMSSIGNPHAFEKTLSAVQANVAQTFRFMDHHQYVEADIDEVVEVCQQNALTTIVTTAKDAVKLKPFMSRIPDSINIYVLSIEVKITENKDTFFERINSIFSNKSCS